MQVSWYGPIYQWMSFSTGIVAHVLGWTYEIAKIQQFMISLR
jgi:hypothetical protein